MKRNVLSWGLGAWLILSASALANPPCCTNKACACKCDCCHAKQTCCQAKDAKETVGITESIFSVNDYVLAQRDGDKWSCHVAVPLLKADPGVSEHFPGLAQRIKMFNDRQYGESRFWMKRFVKTLKEAAGSSAKADGERFLGEQFRYYESHGAVVRADNNVVSMQEAYSSYTGGPHGDYGVLGFTFDPVSGEEIALDSIVNDMPSLRDFVNKTLRTTYPNATFFSRDEVVKRLFMDSKDSTTAKKYLAHHWVMTPSGISVFFNPYEVASYADGLLSVNVDAKTHPELFTKEALGKYFDKNVPNDTTTTVYRLCPEPFKEVIGNWRLVSGHSGKTAFDANKEGVVGVLSIGQDGVAKYSYKDSVGEFSKNEMSVRIVPTPLYEGCAQAKWSMYLFDDDRHHGFQGTVLPDGRMEAVVHIYENGKAEPEIFHGIFVRE